MPDEKQKQQDSAEKGKQPPSKAKRKSSQPGREKPLSLEALREHGALDTFAAPTEPFDPSGQWKNTYRIWLAAPKGRNDRGVLELSRAPSADGKSFTLDVEMDVQQDTPGMHRTVASIQCANDALATPRSWRLQSDILDAQGQPVALAAWKETAQASDGSIEGESNTGRATRKVPSPFASDWSVFEAVQRLGAEEGKALEFALLEGLQLPKGRQRLSFRGKATLTLGDKTLDLLEYQQLGDGILPFLYWVDQNHRLLFAIMGPRAYVFDPQAREHLTKTKSVFSRGKKS